MDRTLTKYQSGTSIIFLPRDSPDYSPITQGARAIRDSITLSRKKLAEAKDKVAVEAILNALLNRTAEENAKEWFRECGYF